MLLLSRVVLGLKFMFSINEYFFLLSCLFISLIAWNIFLESSLTFSINPIEYSVLLLLFIVEVILFNFVSFYVLSL